MQKVLVKITTVDKSGNIIKEETYSYDDGTYFNPLVQDIYNIRRCGNDVPVRMIVDIAFLV